jgi:hypothetical protein
MWWILLDVALGVVAVVLLAVLSLTLWRRSKALFRALGALSEVLSRMPATAPAGLARDRSRPRH